MLWVPTATPGSVIPRENSQDSAYNLMVFRNVIYSSERMQGKLSKREILGVKSGGH